MMYLAEAAYWAAVGTLAGMLLGEVFRPLIPPWMRR